jgi:hypothetical protein
MTTLAILGSVLLTLAAATRPPDIPFRTHMIDPGASETVAVVDINRDGHLDIVSGEHWYAGPGPPWTKHRFRDLGYTSNYIDAFSDLPIDVDGDGFPDIVTVSWFARKAAWWKNPLAPASRRGVPGELPAKAGSEANPGARVDQTPAPTWTETIIESGFPVEFAFLVDLDNDGRARELLPQFGDTKAPLAWYEIDRSGKWIKHVVSPQSYGHGIGAGDVNGDGRADILTPKGWLEAPADPRTPDWTRHADWDEQAQLGFLHVLDINGDGRKDVLTTSAHAYGVLWMEQGADGKWTRRVIDESWSQGHASTLVDLNGDGRLDVVTGKRYMAHNGNDPGEREPLGVYWYEHRASSEPKGGVEWVRHLVDYGGRMGGGMQIPAVDLDGDGDLDLVCAGKSGLFVVENLTRTKSPARAKP